MDTNSRSSDSDLPEVALADEHLALADTMMSIPTAEAIRQTKPPSLAPPVLPPALDEITLSEPVPEPDLGALYQELNVRPDSNDPLANPEDIRRVIRLSADELEEVPPRR